MDDNAFFIQGTSLLLCEKESSSPDIPQLPLLCAEDFPQADVFTVPALTGGDSISCVSIPAGIPLPPHYKTIPIRQAISLHAECWIGLTGPSAGILRAHHIAQWRRESLFCGSCGGKNADSGSEVARVCPVCGRTEYPRISPAVITVIVNNEGQTLLAHNKKFTPGLYSLIAGFAEAGENLETAVARETREETGIEIGDIKYAASQPWPFPNSLMIGFSARYVSGTLRPDGAEIEDVRWFSRENLPSLPSQGSVSRYLIECWLAGKI